MHWSTNAVFCLVTSWAVAGCGGTDSSGPGAPAPAPAAITIAVENNVFAPALDTVAVGGTVTWQWAAGAVQHNIVSAGATTFADHAMVEDAPFSHGPITFGTAGRYLYYCTIHGSFNGQTTSGMGGTIVVR